MSQWISPSPKKKKHYKNFPVFILDSLAYSVSIIAPIMTIPQVLQVWKFHQTAGVSLVSWTSYALINLLWITYGLVHRAKPVTFGNVLMFLLNAAVAVGVIINR